MIQTAAGPANRGDGSGRFPLVRFMPATFIPQLFRRAKNVWRFSCETPSARPPVFRELPFEPCHSINTRDGDLVQTVRRPLRLKARAVVAKNGIISVVWRCWEADGCEVYLSRLLALAPRLFLPGGRSRRGMCGVSTRCVDWEW